MKRPVTLILAGAAVAAIAHAFWAPFPASGGNPVLDLIAYHDPGFHTVIRVWYYAAPAVAVLLFGSLGLSVWRVWLQPRVGSGGRGRLPPWPASADDAAPSVVVGELHHPTVPLESERPSWLVIPETGLYTGVLIVGAVGSGKTSACMYPFAEQLLSWQADRPERRASALVLEIKGDFCRDVRSILEKAQRGGDYLEIGLGGAWQWNPLDDPLLDTYSLAYTVSSLINQLFGKSREPFWQQAYTNLVRWIVELHRLLPGGWVTLQDVYRCTIDAELFAEKIREAQYLVAAACPAHAVISRKELVRRPEALNDWVWRRASGEDRVTARLDPVLRDRLAELKIAYETEETGAGAGSELKEQVEAIERWYRNDWMALDPKVRTSIVEGISVFLSLFDQPQVASVFCPPPPESDDSLPIYIGDDPPGEDAGAIQPMPGLRRRLPPLAPADRRGPGPRPQHARGREPRARTSDRRAAQERVDAGAAPASGRGCAPARTLPPARRLHLRRVSGVRHRGAGRSLGRREGVRADPPVPLHPDRRHAVDLLAPLRAVRHGGLAHTRADATHADLPVLERRIVGQDRLGDVRLRHEDPALVHVHRDHGQAGVLAPLRTRRRGEGHDRREQVVPPGQRARVHAQGLHAARQLPGDLPALRRHEVPACPARLPEAPLPAARRGLLAASRGGPAVKRASGIGHLKPFLPGLEAVLEDPEISELMINGPGNVWVERGGELEALEAPGLTAAALYRAAIHIARPLGLDPAARPVLDARLEDGSRVAICTPPASPHVAMTIRRFGGRAFSAEDLVRQGALPQEVFRAARSALGSRRNVLVSGGTGSGKTTLLNALIELLPEEERIVAIEDTLELRIERANCLRFEAGAVGSEAPVSIRDLVRHALRHRPDHIVVGEVRGGEAADLLQALNTGHGGSLTTVHANNARSALSRLASCAMQAGGALPWDVTCRGVVDGISLVVHMTRHRGRRFVEEALRVEGYDAAANRWAHGDDMEEGR